MAYALDKLKQDLLLTQPSFEQMNMNKVSFAKEMEYALQAFQNNSYLLGMEPNSVRNCLVNVALSGLTLNPVLRLCYLVPRKGKLCLDVGYQGMVKILTDTGSLKAIKADMAYEKDTFDIELGTNGFVKHKPFFGAGSRGRKIGCYSIATLNDGSTQIHFMRYDELMEIKKRSESVKSGGQSPWLTDEDQMCCKTVIKQQAKFLPKSERSIMAFNAISMENEANGIDFKKEQEEAERLKREAGNVDGSTPNSPDVDAFASDEDYVAILTLLDNEMLGTHFITTPMLVSKMKSAIEKQQLETTLLKDKAIEYIKWLNHEIELAIKKSSELKEEGGKENAGGTDASETNTAAG